MVHRALILLAACGGGGGGGAMPDATPTGHIGVHAAAGTHVLFRGADGVVQDVVSGEDGFAIATSSANTSATVLASATMFYGYEGLNPGDSVVPPPAKPALPTRLTATVTLPRYATATDYYITGSDDVYGFANDDTASSTLTGTIGFDDKPLAHDATVFARTTVGDDAYSFVEHADLTTGAVTLPAFQPTPTISLTATNIAPSVQQVGFTIDRYASDDLASPLTSANLVDADPPTYRGKVAPVGEVTRVRGYFGSEDGSDSVQYLATSTEPLTVDGAQMPHAGSNAKWIGTKAAWEERSDGVDPLLSQVVFMYEDKQITVVAPYTGPSMTLPPLPDTVDTSDTSTIKVVGASTMSFAPGTSYLDAIPQLDQPRWRAVILQPN